MEKKYWVILHKMYSNPTLVDVALVSCGNYTKGKTEIKGTG